MDRAPCIVLYGADELCRAASCDTLMQGRVRRVLRHRGGLWVITGYASGGIGGVHDFDACRAVCDADFRGEKVTYEQRCRRLSQLDHEDRAAAARLRARFYEGMAAACGGRLYRLTRETQNWQSAGEAYRTQDDRLARIRRVSIAMRT